MEFSEYLRLLNDSLREGIAHGGREGSSHVVDEDKDPVAELVQLCAESGLKSVDFRPYNATGEKPFAASTVLDVTDQLKMTIWSDHGYCGFPYSFGKHASCALW